MIKIQQAKTTDVEVLALLGTISYTESHGQFIEDKNDLNKYNERAFSVSKINQDINDPKNLFYLIYVNDLPVGYAKLMLNAVYGHMEPKNSCRLERIYVLNDYIPLKIGQSFLNFLEEKTKALQLDTMWLSVYRLNQRAIRFYEKNDYNRIGNIGFVVNGKEYENIVFSKKI